MPAHSSTTTSIPLISTSQASWTYGGTPIYIKDIYLSNDGVNPTEVSQVASSDEVVSREYYTLSGAEIVTPIHGICIIKEVTKSGNVRFSKACYK